MLLTAEIKLVLYGFYLRLFFYRGITDNQKKSTFKITTVLCDGENGPIEDQLNIIKGRKSVKTLRPGKKCKGFGSKERSCRRYKMPGSLYKKHLLRARFSKFQIKIKELAESARYFKI